MVSYYSLCAQYCVKFCVKCICVENLVPQLKEADALKGKTGKVLKHHWAVNLEDRIVLLVRTGLEDVSPNFLN